MRNLAIAGLGCNRPIPSLVERAAGTTRDSAVSYGCTREAAMAVFDLAPVLAPKAKPATLRDQVEDGSTFVAAEALGGEAQT
jgi:hypothetical protein